MAQKADDIRNKDTDTVGNDEISVKIIESIAELNNNVSSLSDSFTNLLDRIEEVIKRVDTYNTKADGLTKQIAAGQQSVHDSIHADIAKGIKESMLKMDKDMKAITISSKQQIDSYTEESRIRRDLYQRSQKKDRLHSWINTGLLVTNIIFLMYIHMSY